MNAADIIDGRYRLERLLGTGGMAEVWLAEDQRLGRWVAIKALHQSFSQIADKETIASFEREALVVARLQHQGIVGIYDVGTHEQRRFIVMEYVHGYSLRQILETQGRLTEREAVRYAVQIAAALQYAHEHGVLHCDIKPENIIVGESGAAKIADFGVAESITRTMTPGQAQNFLGTIGYLAPEIIEGAPASPASDTYSLALTVFELIAGRSPFAGATAGASLGQRLATPAPPIRAFAQSATPEIEAVLKRALALSPADRFASAAAFATALQRLPGPAVNVRPAPIAAPPGRPPQLHGRHPTARIRTSPPDTRGSGPNASTILVAVGVVLAALGVGVAAAILLSRADNNGGGVAPTPTATVRASATTPAPTRTQPPTAVATATTTPTTPASPSPLSSPVLSPTVTRTPTPSATATRTPTPGVTTTPVPSPTVGLTPTPTP